MLVEGPNTRECYFALTDDFLAFWRSLDYMQDGVEELDILPLQDVVLFVALQDCFIVQTEFADRCEALQVRVADGNLEQLIQQLASLFKSLRVGEAGRRRAESRRATFARSRSRTPKFSTR